MSCFTNAEIEFLANHRIGRLATVGGDGMPHVVPVAVFYDPDTQTLVVGSNAAFGEAAMAATKKFRDARRQPKVAVVVDDGSPQFIEVRGIAETHLEGGGEIGTRLAAPFQFGAAWMRIRPRRIVAGGVNGGQFDRSARDVV